MKNLKLSKTAAIICVLMLILGTTLESKAQNTSKYDNISPYSEGMAVVRVGDYQNGKYGFIDKAGNEIVPPIYDGAEKFSDGMAVIKKGYKYGFVDKAGNIVVEPKYPAVRSFVNGMARVMKDSNVGKYGYINKSGELVIDADYKRGENFSEGSDGLAAVTNDDYKYGFINKSGEVVIPFKYDSAGRMFRNGSIKVRLDGEWFKINKNGERID